MQIADFSASNVSAMYVSEFIHESVHVWQYEQWGLIEYGHQALQASGSNAYDHAITATSNFSAFNMEGQAMISQNYYLMTHGFTPLKALNNPSAGEYGSVLSQVRR